MGVGAQTTFFNSVIKEYFSKLPEFPEIFGIVSEISKGRIYVVGGRLIRVLSNWQYNTDMPLGDLDLMTQRKADVETLAIPGWKVQETSFGDLRYVKEDDEKISFDLMRLTNYHPAIRDDVEPKMDYFFKSVPLNVHAIAYEVRTGKLRGRPAIRGIMKKLVWINNRGEAEHAAKNRGVTLEKYVESKADELEYGFIPPGREVYEKIV